MIYNIYIFNKRGACLYYREWNRPYNSFSATAQDEERKLVYGMILSIKDLIGKMKSSPLDDGLHCLKTNTFTLHHYETRSGLRFVLNSDVGTPDLHANLVEIYGNLFVEFVTKNPTFDPAFDGPLDSPMFEKVRHCPLLDMAVPFAFFAYNFLLDQKLPGASRVRRGPCLL